MGLCTQRAMHRFQQPRAFSFSEETLHRSKRAARSCVRSRYNPVRWRERFARMRRAPILREFFSSNFLCGWDDFLPHYGAVHRVDQGLNLGELAACSRGLVPVKRSGQYLRVHVPILDHALTGLFQCLESFIHLGTFACLLVTTTKPSVEGGRKLAFTEDDRRLLVIVTHLGISRGREGNDAQLAWRQSLCSSDGACCRFASYRSIGLEISAFAGVE